MEEPKPELEVQIISTEIMKPSAPTPLDRKSYNLSSLDQASPLKHFPILLCYANSTDHNQPIDMNALKTCLRETLSQFYPLAGRCEGESTISCNDQGIPLIETRVSSSLSDVLNSPHKLHTVYKLLPSRQLYMSYGQLPISEVVHLAFQFNVFSCGGVVIGCYLLHKLLDACSAGNFLNYWAALANPGSATLNACRFQPDFNAVVKAFPPRAPANNAEGGTSGGHSGLSSLASRLAQVKSIQVAGKSFVFSNASIRKMKAMATIASTTSSCSDHIPYPTSFEAVTGFIWHHIFAAACTATCLQGDDSSVTTEILFMANVRPKSCPPLQSTSIGNLCKSVHVQVNNLRDFPELTADVHAAISKTMENLKGSLPEINPFANRDYNKLGSYVFSSWCKLGFNEIDFGFGKPNRVIPVGMVHPFLRNSVLLVDYIDQVGDYGIEAWLFLEANEMQVLESNPQFLVFALPS